MACGPSLPPSASLRTPSGHPMVPRVGRLLVTQERAYFGMKGRIAELALLLSEPIKVGDSAADVALLKVHLRMLVRPCCSYYSCEGSDDARVHVTEAPRLHDRAGRYRTLHKRRDLLLDRLGGRGSGERALAHPVELKRVIGVLCRRWLGGREYLWDYAAPSDHQR